MRCFRLTIAYDGTPFAGWQVQPDQLTVQGALEQALQRITGESIRTVASGRTDAGVHALRQVVSFRSATSLRSDVLCRAINANTPEEIHVWEVSQAADDFHAIRDAVAKRYRYMVQDGPHRDLFARKYSWHVPRRLDLEAMRAGARHLVGRHDFASFQAAGAPRKSSVRTIHELRLERVSRHGTDPMSIEVEADGFLYNMVRNIAGTLVCVGRGDKPADWVASVLAGRQRSLAGPTAPALGLMLLSVQYAPKS